jgi:hypothetical protein
MIKKIMNNQWLSATELLSAEKLLALVEPPERIRLAIEGGKGELVVAWHSMALRRWWNMGLWRREVHGSGRQSCGLWRIAAAV